MKKEIGGFFELELAVRREYHAKAIRLNSGRNCLRYMIRTKKPRHLYVPFYICQAVLEPLAEMGVSYEFYHINEHWEIQNIPRPKKDEKILVLNYFGLKDKYVASLAAHISPIHLVVDNSQAFYAKPLAGIDTFYSPRKFFGVPDGGYLYCKEKMVAELPKEESHLRCQHLLGRMEHRARDFFEQFRENEKRIAELPLAQMSELTRKILCSIEYGKAKKKREENFIYIHEHLHRYNEMVVDTRDISGPMAYPFLCFKQGLRKKLKQKNIYVPTYWEEVLERDGVSAFEAKLVRHLLPLPIDQRYGLSEMKQLVSALRSL